MDSLRQQVGFRKSGAIGQCPPERGLLNLALTLTMFGVADANAQDNISHPRLRDVPPPASRTLAGSREFFVDPVRGDDRASGSLQQPWKTAAHGVGQLKAGDTLVLRGGVYYERLYVALAGQPEAPITIRSFPGEQATIDGGLREFYEAPQECWQPAGGGAADEFISTKAYPNLREVVGSFGDSLIGLQTYYHAGDLRAKNELVDWEDWERTDASDIKPLYCGPGLWYDRASGRIHCRLAHTHLPEPVANYGGQADPRKLPLIIAPLHSVPLTLDGAQHVRLQDLVIRGGGYTALAIRYCRGLEIDNCTIWCGTYGLQIIGAEDFKLVHSRLYGSLAPWTFRNDASKRDYPGRPHRNISRLNTHALIEIDAGRESSVYYTPQNDRWEIAHCHLADAHDGVYLGGINAQFHHNLIENLQDDGLYLSAMYLRHRLDDKRPQIHVFQNTFRQLLTPLAFGGDQAETHDEVFIYRNVFDLRKNVQTGRPTARRPEPGFSSGKPLGDHGSPPWPAMNLYHNTFVMAEPARDAAMNTLGSTRSGHPRQVFNNLFIHLARLPAFVPPAAGSNVISDGNWYWSPTADAKQHESLLTKYRGSPAFAESKTRYAAGCEANSRVGDPKLSAIADNFALGGESGPVNAGVAISGDWPDPVRARDAGAADIGAFPLAVP